MRRYLTNAIRKYSRKALAAASPAVRVRLLRLLLQSFGTNVVTPYNQGRNLIIPPLDGILQTVLTRGEYHETADAEFVRAVTHEDDVIVDVGANIGFYTVLFAELVRHGRGVVYAFEPTPSTFRRLQQNCGINGFGPDKVILSNTALLDSPGQGELHCYEDVGQEDVASAGWNTFGNPQFRDGLGRKIATRSVVVDVTTLDDALTLHDVRRLNVVKIDAEGAECLVLRGASKTLDRYAQRDDFLMMIELEDDHLRSMGSSLAEVIGMLRGYGLKICRFDRSTRRLVTERDAGFRALENHNGILCSNVGYWSDRLAGRQTATEVKECLHAGAAL